jgi:2-keto-4-pentenoate hydratase/2-oxohepta-3-ene-1,7-dioic acid hydratase in catechol pathway
MSLNNGDIVMTGTPKGVGVLKSGSVYQALIKSSQKILLKQQWIAK